MADLELSAACRVCGHPDLHVDEVAAGGGMILCECPRCSHRFTGARRQARSRVALAAEAPVVNALPFDAPPIGVFVDGGAPRRAPLAARRGARPVPSAA